MKFYYETERLMLRNFTESDFCDLCSIVLDNRNFTYTGDGITRSKEEVKLLLDYYIENLTSLNIAIVLKETNVIVGILCINYRYNMPIGDLNCIVHYDYQNKKIMSEALQKMIEIAFNQMNLERLTAELVEDNIASARLLEKQGFKLEGIKEKDFFLNNTFFNVKCYGLIKS